MHELAETRQSIHPSSAAPYDHGATREGRGAARGRTRCAARAMVDPAIARRPRRLTPHTPNGLESRLFTVSTSSASMLGSSDDAEATRAFTDAHRELIARRLPLVAIAWLGVGLAMRSGLILQSALTPRTAILSLSLQAVIFAIAILLCRADPRGPRVIPVTLAACALLSLLSAAFFAHIGGVEEGLTFALFTLGLGSSVAFAWGWRPALAHLAASVVSGFIAAPYLGFFATRTERVLEVAIGSCVWLGVAELSARSFRSGWYQERARRAAAEKLAASLAAYRDLAENARDLIFTHDLDGRITYVNEAFARSCGLTAAELIGRDGPRPGAARSRQSRSRTRSSRASRRARTFRRSSTGSPARRRAAGSSASSPAIRDADGRIVGARGIARDVTDGMRRERRCARRSRAAPERGAAPPAGAPSGEHPRGRAQAARLRPPRRRLPGAGRHRHSGRVAAPPARVASRAEGRRRSRPHRALRRRGGRAPAAARARSPPHAATRSRPRGEPALARRGHDRRRHERRRGLPDRASRGSAKRPRSASIASRRRRSPTPSATAGAGTIRLTLARRRSRGSLSRSATTVTASPSTNVAAATRSVSSAWRSARSRSAAASSCARRPGRGTTVRLELPGRGARTRERRVTARAVDEGARVR